MTISSVSVSSSRNELYDNSLKMLHQVQSARPYAYYIEAKKQA